MAAHTTVREVLAALEQVDFPAGKDDLLTAARAAGASEEVQKALRGIPPESYANRDEVARSVRLDPSTEDGLDASDRAAQARAGGRPGLGQHETDARSGSVVEEELQRPTGRFGS